MTKQIKKQLFNVLLLILTSLSLILSLFYLGVSKNMSLSWDGSGHQSISLIYSDSIYPNIQGWNYTYFSGMPFPNFYPPIFYLFNGLLNQWIGFDNTFKILIIAPIFFLPIALWFLIYNLTDKKYTASFFGVIGGLFLLADARFVFSLPAGLDFFSTFQIGLYTQPLGFLFLLLWYMNFLKTEIYNWRFILSTLLLGLTVLSNFFAGITATLMAIVVILEDLYLLWKSRKILSQDAEETNIQNRDRSKSSFNFKSPLAIHILSCFLAFLLTLFWLLPMLTQYKYFTTRPYIVEGGQLLSSAWWYWFGLAVFGFYIWFQNQTRAFWSFSIFCFILTVIIIFATFIAPDWFPLQSPRFLAMLNFLLVVPVGIGLSKIFRWFAKLLGEIKDENESFALKKFKYTTGVFGGILLILIISSPGTGTKKGLGFIGKDEKPELAQILEFGKQHQDGRYLVEVIHPQKTAAYTEAAFDARAINAYLGSNGNETLSAVFHEASPHSLFMLPVVNSLSDYPDSFGISSVLSDDLDFQAQPIEKHIERAKFLGVKYLVIRTPAMKEKLSKFKGIAQKYDFGWWTIYQLNSDDRTNSVGVGLTNKPALIFSDFTLKARYRNDLSYIRFVEEQFNDGWFDVLLTRSPANKIEQIIDWRNFGAVIVNDYNYDNDSAAYEKLKEISQERLIILVSSDDKLFNRISQNRKDFLKIEIIQRPQITERGEMLKSDHPSFHYDGTPIRKMWQTIREILSNNKVPTGVNDVSVSAQKLLNQIHINFTADNEIPVLVANTFHPSWKRSDGKEIYTATPFYQLTFVKEPIDLIYERNSIDKIASLISAITLLLIIGIGFIVFAVRNLIF